MEPVPFPRLLAAYALLFGLPLLIFLFPRSGMSRRLTMAVGPNLDPRLQTRGECRRNAGKFLLLGLASLVAAIGTGMLADWWFAPVDPPLPILALVFTYALMGFVGLGGALYLLVKAPFRPIELPFTKPALDLRILKSYQSMDKSYEVLIAFDPEDRAYVIIPLRSRPEGELPPRLEGPIDSLEEAESLALVEAGHSTRDGV